MKKASVYYHLLELTIARDPMHPSHCLPPKPSASGSVVDIGCGAGQTLLATCPDRISHGLDTDYDALQLGRSLSKKIRFVCGDAEALPYRSENFDIALSRVSLNWCNLPLALDEICRVLRRGGEAWITLQPFAPAWKQAKRCNWRGRLFFAYVIINSLFFHFRQKQFQLMGRCESFTTKRGISKALQERGFEDVRIEASRERLVVHARRKL